MVLYFPHENSHLCNKIIPLFRSKKMRLFQAKDIVTLFPPPLTPQKSLVSLVIIIPIPLVHFTRPLKQDGVLLLTTKGLNVQ